MTNEQRELIKKARREYMREYRKHGQERPQETLTEKQKAARNKKKAANDRYWLKKAMGAQSE